LWGDKPFPFEQAIGQFRATAEHYPEDKLPVAVEAICKALEESA
jgi:hypothetical protein